jgi:hypothetical protein
LILFGYFHSFRVVLVEIANITSVGSVHFAFGRNEGRRVVLLIDLLPVNAVEEWMSFDLERFK